MQVKVVWDTSGLLGELKGEAWHTVEKVVAQQESRGILGSIVSAITGGSGSNTKVAPITHDLETEDGIQSAVLQTQSDLRSMATALEAYSIDWDTYPSEPQALTTPISYLSKEPTDVFDRENAPVRLSVFNPEDYSESETDDGGRPIYTRFKIWSVGPDRKDQQGDIIYDPTNGLVSSGDIVRINIGR